MQPSRTVPLDSQSLLWSLAQRDWQLEEARISERSLRSELQSLRQDVCERDGRAAVELQEESMAFQHLRSETKEAQAQLLAAYQAVASLEDRLTLERNVRKEQMKALERDCNDELRQAAKSVDVAGQLEVSELQARLLHVRRDEVYANEEFDASDKKAQELVQTLEDTFRNREALLRKLRSDGRSVVVPQGQSIRTSKIGQARLAEDFAFRLHEVLTDCEARERATIRDAESEAKALLADFQSREEVTHLKLQEEAAETNALRREASDLRTQLLNGQLPKKGRQGSTRGTSEVDEQVHELEKMATGLEREVGAFSAEVIRLEAQVEEHDTAAQKAIEREDLLRAEAVQHFTEAKQLHEDQEHVCSRIQAGCTEMYFARMISDETSLMSPVSLSPSGSLYLSDEAHGAGQSADGSWLLLGAPPKEGHPSDA